MHRISFNEIIRSRIEGSAEYFGGFAGYNYGHITNCEIHDTDIVWNDQEAAKGGRKQAYVGGITGANDARAVLFDGKMQMQRLVCCQIISGIPHRRFILEALQEAVPEKFREESWKMEKSAALQQDQMFKRSADCMWAESQEEMRNKSKRTRMDINTKAPFRNVRS